MSFKPRIYIACLSAYNNGKLHGEWVDADCIDSINEALVDIIKTSPEPDAEEWAIHDNEYFAPFTIAEYEGFEEVCQKADILSNLESDDLLDAFQEWDEAINYDLDTVEDIFRECYKGKYDSKEDYAFELMNDCYEIPEYLSSYIDYEKFWNDLTYDGYSAEYSCGGYHIYSGER